MSNASLWAATGCSTCTLKCMSEVGHRQGLLNRVGAPACARRSSLVKDRYPHAGNLFNESSEVRRLLLLMGPAMTLPGRRKLFERAAQALRSIEPIPVRNHHDEPTSFPARTNGQRHARHQHLRPQKARHLRRDGPGSNRYANALRAFGVRKGYCAAVTSPSRIEFPLPFFAFAKLGAVPINMRYPPRETVYTLSESAAKFAIFDKLAAYVQNDLVKGVGPDPSHSHGCCRESRHDVRCAVEAH
ncbi:AMP-binding protein [Bradyrhizobium sp. LMG 9283]|uniref:AMP-binding protein n=1 Tax=Bradyrhizobium sp. LMG 9283 TaxID=592064 RepID=UPI00388F4A18